MTNPASTADVVARWRTLSAQEEINAQTFLDDAWGMLQRRIPDLDDKITADVDGFTDAVIRALATAVVRVMKNPDGKRRETIDDYSWERDQALSAGLLYFTDEELDDLNPGSGVKGRAYTLDPFADRDWNDWS